MNTYNDINKPKIRHVKLDMIGLGYYIDYTYSKEPEKIGIVKTLSMSAYSIDDNNKIITRSPK